MSLGGPSRHFRSILWPLEAPLISTARMTRRSTRLKWQPYGQLAIPPTALLVRCTDRSLHARTVRVFRFNQLTQGIYITLPYTLAVYMVRHFEGDLGTEESIGRNTGLLVSIHPLAVLSSQAVLHMTKQDKSPSCSIETCLSANLPASLKSP